MESKNMLFFGGILKFAKKYRACRGFNVRRRIPSIGDIFYKRKEAKTLVQLQQQNFFSRIQK
jgi:hypothetical protein